MTADLDAAIAEALRGQEARAEAVVGRPREHRRVHSLEEPEARLLPRSPVAAKGGRYATNFRGLVLGWIEAALTSWPKSLRFFVNARGNVFENFRESLSALPMKKS